jgi:cytochrome b
MNGKRILLWDLPTRVFHWMLVIAVIAAIVSGQLGGNLMDWHGRIGLLIVGLISFRLVWGVVGSTYARFIQFFPTPAKIKAYLRGDWQGEGHNPLGALSVLGLLGLLSVQLVTGLFANDDITFTGPLFDLVSKNLSNQMTGVHSLLSNVLIALIVVHIAAIGYYGHVKKQKLLKPMIRGWKDDGAGESAQGGGWLAQLVALTIAGALVFVAAGGCLPAPPPPPPAVETPNW